jgi:uncharacterized tellurite resistance protein B-like protein
MLSALRRFLTDLRREGQPVPMGEAEVRVAAAALLVHVMAVDGVVRAEERSMLVDLLQREYQLDARNALALVAEAETAEAEAIDLFAFTSVLKQRLEEADRERIVELMWRLVFADGDVHEFEDNVIWRVAELLGVSSQARIRLKQAVRRDAG